MPYTTGARYMQHYITHYIGKLRSHIGAMFALMRQFRCNTNAISASGIRVCSLKCAMCTFLTGHLLTQRIILQYMKSSNVILI